MAFLVGILSLIPIQWIGEFQLDIDVNTLIIFAIGLIFVVLTGTLIGEAVHALAIYIENSLAWVGRRVNNIIDLGKDENCIPNIKKRYQPYVDPTNPDEEAQAGRTLPRRILTNWKYGILKWVASRIYGLKLGLIRHRVLFTGKITRPLGLPEDGPKERSVERLDEVQRYLVESAEDEFNVESKEDAKCVYPVVTTLLSSNDITRPDEFQARYSFCRSMWVIILIMVVFYLFLPLYPYDPIVEVVIPETWILLIILSIFLLFFLTSAGKYKKYYVEYLLAGFFLAGKHIQEAHNQTEQGSVEQSAIKKIIGKKFESWMR